MYRDLAHAVRCLQKAGAGTVLLHGASIPLLLRVRYVRWAQRLGVSMGCCGPESRAPPGGGSNIPNPGSQSATPAAVCRGNRAAAGGRSYNYIACKTGVSAKKLKYSVQCGKAVENAKDPDDRVFCAEGRDRTGMRLPSLVFETSASAYSATSARARASDTTQLYFTRYGGSRTRSAGRCCSTRGVYWRAALHLWLHRRSECDIGVSWRAPLHRQRKNVTIMMKLRAGQQRVTGEFAWDPYNSFRTLSI